MKYLPGGLHQSGCPFRLWRIWNICAALWNASPIRIAKTGIRNVFFFDIVVRDS